MRTIAGPLLLLLLNAAPVLAEPITFASLYTSRATFRTEAPLETIVGTTGGPPGQPTVSGTVVVDLARPQAAQGTIKVDLNAIRTGIDRRDAHMRSADFLDSEKNEANRFATFEIRGVEITGPLEAGKEMPAKVKGVLTIKGKGLETMAESRITYVRLSPEQVESQKRFGFAAENLRVQAKFDTKFTHHGMQVPQLLFLKVSNDIQLEADLVLARQP